MPDQRPPKTPSFVPAFLLRLRARRRALDSTMPSWLRWNVAVMLLAALGFGVLLWILSPILAPFLAAVILAYIFDPLVTKLQARGISRTVGAVVAILVLLLAVALLLLIVLPLFYKELAQLFEQIPNLAEQLKTGVLPWLNEKLGSSVTLDPASFRQFITDNMSDASGIAKRVFASIGVGGVALVGVLINLLLIPIVFFYVLRDWPVFVGNIDSLLPRAMHSGVSQIVREIDAVLSEFLRGQISVMLIMAVFYVVGLSIAGLDFALPVGLITGLLVFIP